MLQYRKYANIAIVHCLYRSLTKCMEYTPCNFVLLMTV